MIIQKGKQAWYDNKHGWDHDLYKVNLTGRVKTITGGPEGERTYLETTQKGITGKRLKWVPADRISFFDHEVTEIRHEA